MLIRKIKQFSSMLMALAVCGSMIINSGASVAAKESIALGQNGYMSLHAYTSATDIKDVYKVDLTLDVNVRIDPADVVFVVDNSGSMGWPEDQTPELKGWTGGTNWTQLAADMSPYGWTTDFIGMSYQLPAGAWPGGFDLATSPALPSVPPTSFGYTVSEAGAFKTEAQTFRFEWMKEGLTEAIDQILNPKKNGAASKTRVAVFGYGDGGTDPTGTTNNLLAQNTGGPWDWEYVPNSYNWANAGHVWASDYHLNFNLPDQGGVFSYSNVLTFNSNMDPATTRTDVSKNSWKTSGEQDALNAYINENLVRRDEGTTMAGGLAAAYKLLESTGNPKAKKYVFLLTDGTETTDRSNDGITNNDFCESILLAANLRQMDVEIHGVGILDNGSSLFDSNGFTGGKFGEGTAHENTVVSSIKDYIMTRPVVSGVAREDPYTGEAHLLRVLTPTNENSIQRQGIFTGTEYTGSDFMLNYKSSVPVKRGFGYQELVEDLAANGEFDKIKYTRTDTANGVKQAFRDFANAVSAASSIKPDITLGQYFTIYQMPGKELFAATNGSSATGGGRSILWNVPDLPAGGGSYKLTFYVKLNAPADQDGIWQALLDSFMVSYKDYNGDLTKKGIPNNFVVAQTEEEKVEIDHRERTDYDHLAKKKSEAAFVVTASTVTTANVTDIKAKAAGKGRVKLSLSLKDAADYSYQWQYRADGDEKWISIIGANASVFTTGNLKLKPGTYNFRCAIRSRGADYVFSKDVSLTLTEKDC